MNTTDTKRKFLKDIASKLPAMQYTVIYQTNIKGSDALLTGLDCSKIEDFDPDKEYTFKTPVYLPVNHKRRLCRAYKSGGHEAVMNYLKPYIAKKVNLMQFSHMLKNALL